MKNKFYSAKKLFVGALATTAMSATLVFTGNSVVNVRAEVTKVSELQTNTKQHNYGRWASTIKSYLVSTDNGTLMRVQSDGTNVYVEYYDSEYNVIAYNQIPTELPIFGGFYEGSDAYYLVTGQSNNNELADVECYRITKYDKNWNRITSTGLSDCNTTVPFMAGSLRMTEANGYLLIRTCHQMYTSEDGYNHQANVTIQVDENQMQITDYYTDIMNVSYGYVSHSFNQFIKTDGNHIVAVDHGDAYPRSIALIEYPTDFTTGKFISNLGWGENCKSTDLLSIAGNIGDNTTNATVGGFEVTNSAYLVAASSIDQQNDGYYSNICVLGKSKEDGHTFINWITNIQDGFSATTPYMVKVDDNKYFLMWTYGQEKDGSGEISYTYIDANGNQTSPIYTMKGNISDCEPICVNGSIIWYTSEEGSISFYGLNSDGTVIGSRNGLVLDGDTWVYYRNDEPDYSYTGLALNEYGWWYVKNGTIDWDYTGMALNEYGWWYVSNGTIDWNYTGMALNEYGWWYIRNGALDLSYTGMALNDYGWWYIRNGALDLSYTGMALNEYGWWYMRNGALDLSYTGMALNEYGWWYMRNGALDLSYTGMALNEYGWWYIRNGALDLSYTGLAENEYGLWYMKNGALDLTYTGIVTNEDGTFEVVKGHVN